MVGVVRIYRNRNRTCASVSLTGLLLWVFSFSLQSCSSILSRGSNIIPITGEDLLNNDLLIRQRGITLRDEGQPLVEELRRKIRVLQRRLFLGGQDPNDDNIKKHFIFVFYHWLGYKQSGMVWNNRIPTFMQIGGANRLVWTPHLLPFDIRRQKVEFRLNNLFTNRDPFRDDMNIGNVRVMGNLTRKRLGNSPLIMYNGRQNIVHIDHLFRDDSVTIELPEELHNEKTDFVDNLLNLSRRPPNRQPTRNYWINRLIN